MGNRPCMYTHWVIDHTLCYKMEQYLKATIVYDLLIFANFATGVEIAKLSVLTDSVSIIILITIVVINS